MAIQVFIFGSPSSKIIDILQEDGDISVTSSTSFTAAELSNYQVFINLRQNDYLSSDVQAWVKNGGGWIGEWQANDYPISKWTAINGKAALTGAKGAGAITVNDESHYIAKHVSLKSITRHDAYDFQRNISVNDPDATVIATSYHESYRSVPFLVDKAYGLGRILLFNSDWQDGTEHQNEMKKLMRHMVRWAASKVDTRKYLIEDGTDIKKWDKDDAKWEIVGTSPVTDEVFVKHGMDSSKLDHITNTAIQALSSPTPKLLSQVPDSNPIPQSKITAIPKPQLVLPTADFSISNIEGIDAIELKSKVFGDGTVKVIVSVDGGTAWKAWDGSAWVTVDINNLSDVKLKGMDDNYLNNIVRSQWDMLTGTGTTKSNVIRFGYYLEQTFITDEANTDNISLTAGMLGTWTLAKPFTEYTYEYPKNNLLRVLIFTNGDYKINY